MLKEPPTVHQLCALQKVLLPVGLFLLELFQSLAVVSFVLLLGLREQVHVVLEIFPPGLALVLNHLEEPLEAALVHRVFDPDRLVDLVLRLLSVEANKERIFFSVISTVVKRSDLTYLGRF